MEKELAEMLDQGLTKDQILDRFVAKYGASVLSAPPTKGAFNISAWIMPFVALLAGGVVVVVVLRKWNSQTVPATPEPVDNDASRRLEEELKRFTPED
jgi:cytochrome c-type biogenesis protein CcmH